MARGFAFPMRSSWPFSSAKESTYRKVSVPWRRRLISSVRSLHSWPLRIQGIVRATRTHATNLATFVFLYKSILLLQKKFNGGKVHKTDTFIAGLIGGYIVFGDRNQVNEQVRFIYHSTFIFIFDTAL